MSATKMTPHERRVMKDALATIQVLAEMVSEAHDEGTCLGVDLAYVPAVRSMLHDVIEARLEELAYPDGLPCGDDDEVWNAMYDTWVAPINRRAGDIRTKIRNQLVENERLAAGVPS